MISNNHMRKLSKKIIALLFVDRNAAAVPLHRERHRHSTEI